MKHLHLLFNHT